MVRKSFFFIFDRHEQLLYLLDSGYIDIVFLKWQASMNSLSLKYDTAQEEFQKKMGYQVGS